MKSFYLALKNCQVKFPKQTLWKLKLPMKIKVFLWLLLHRSILTKYNLPKRDWHGEKKCKFCAMDESIDHLFFSCPMARYVQRAELCSFNLKTTPGSSSDLTEKWIQQFSKSTLKLVLIGVAVILWTLWKARNCACFQNILPADRLPLIYSRRELE